MSTINDGLRKRRGGDTPDGSQTQPLLPPQRTDVHPRSSKPTTTAATTTTKHSSSSSVVFDRLENYLSGKSTAWAIVVPLVLFVVLILVNVGLSAYVNPKPLEEQLDDMRHLLRFTFHHYILREETPCDYDGVRFLPWGQAIDRTGLCSCHLRRCPLLKAAEDPAQGAGEVLMDDTNPLTIASLRRKCEAQGFHYDMQASGQTVLVVPVESTETTSHTMHYFTTPVCVQSGQIHYTLTDGDRAHNVTYENGYVLGQKTKMFVEDLTDSTLLRARRMHPVTVVPATGLFFNGFHNSGSELLDLLLYGGMLRLGGLLADLRSEPQAEKAADPTPAPASPTGENGTASPVSTKAPASSAPVKDAQLLDALQHHSRQSIFISSLRDGEHPDPRRYVTEDDGVLGRMWANALTRVLEHGHSDGLSPTPAFFSIAPVSRNRPGDVTRGPMYCFCQGLLVPGRRRPSENNRAYLTADNLRVSFGQLREAVNAHFREAPLGSDLLAKSPGLSPAVVTQQTAAYRRAHKPHLAAKYWPVAEEEEGKEGSHAPHLLYISRKSLRVHHEAEVLSLARHVGFSVAVVTEEELLEMGAEEQFYLGRYADVVAGAPGPFTALALFMDLTPPYRVGCRTLFELAPYANHQKLTKDREVAEGVGADYVQVVPRDVVLEGAVLEDLEQRGKSLAEGKAELRLADAHSRRLPGFTDQTAIYDMKEVEERLEEVHAHVSKCLGK